MDCEYCGKACYPGQEAALAAARRWNRERGTLAKMIRSVYECCDSWHITKANDPRAVPVPEEDLPSLTPWQARLSAIQARPSA